MVSKAAPVIKRTCTETSWFQKMFLFYSQVLIWHHKASVAPGNCCKMENNESHCINPVCNAATVAAGLSELDRIATLKKKDRKVNYK